MKFSLAATVAFFLSANNGIGNGNGNISADAFAFVPTYHSRTLSSSSLKMATGGSMNVKPIGIGSASPKTIVTNSDLESVVETSDEWIRTRTGIFERRLLLNDESIRTLSIEAASKALEMSGLSPEDIDIVICATSSADDLYGDAPSIASALGCDNAFAYDLTAACSGFLFGTVTAGQFLNNANGGMKNAIVIGADALSRWTDWDDRNSCILFGDGAGAMVLTATDDANEEESGLLSYSMHSNGKGYKNLTLKYTSEPCLVKTPGEGTTIGSGSYKHTEMNGKEVYKFATREVPKVMQEALDKANMSADDIDHLLLHQANIRIMETVASRLGVPFEKVITNLSKYGNTSAASIPLALDEAVRTGVVKKGDIIACAGFGAGLSWGSCILKWG